MSRSTIERYGVQIEIKYTPSLETWSSRVLATGNEDWSGNYSSLEEAWTCAVDRAREVAVRVGASIPGLTS